MSTPAQLIDALAKARAGDTLLVRGGTYTLDKTLAASADGTSSRVITLRAYPGDNTRPQFNFSAMTENSANRGMVLSGDYWHIYGIDFYQAGDNCLFISGAFNTVEFSTFSECADTGLQLGSGANNNTILNCDSFYNADSSLENADGFAAKLDVGSGNKFIGCRAWNNLDDGWDGYLRGADNVSTSYENCWAFRNGFLKSGVQGAGDGNGFKTGGSDDKLLKHHASYKSCVAAGNSQDGFDHNSNRGSVTILNASTYNNGNNINFSSTNSAQSLTIKNTISFSSKVSIALNASMATITNNSWQNGESAISADFVSLDINVLAAPRKADGSLPDINFMQLAPGSSLINTGVNVNLPFKGSAPDLGAFESP